MSYEPNDPITPVEPATPEVTAQPKLYTEEEVNQRIASTLKARLKDRGSSAQPAAQMQQPQINPMEYVHINDVKKIVDEAGSQKDAELKVNSVKNKIMAAADQDPEFRKLLEGNNVTQGRGLSSNDLYLMGEMDLPNAPLIAKQLLKDKNDYLEFIASSDAEKIKFLKDKSRELDNKNTKQTSNNYKVIPDLSGSSDEDMDMSKYGGGFLK